MKGMGKVLIVAGIVLLVLGVIIHFSGNIFSWFGNLPGDIKVEKPGFKFYFPIVSFLLLSALLNVLIWLFQKFF